MREILLLHGAIGAKDQFNDLVQKLEGRFKVHTMNFSGHGGAVMPESFSIEGFAQDVAEYLSAINLQSVGIFGYSMGGYVALYLAKEHPQLVNRIFTLATKFDWSPEIALKETRMLDAAKIADKVPAFAAALEQRHYPNDWKQVLSETAKMMVAMGSENPLSLADFSGIHVPVRIGIGDRDAMVTLEETIAVYRQLPNASLTVFPDMAHPIEKVAVNLLGDALDSFFL
ncbi:MAG: alpha/beta hydrolase [Flavobacterium sp. BFFFF1]|uniref:alpha/beta fold hydrolase n=1 Tax=Flavobacterium sp. BFFFF1 TaxID=2015557 RepID=UPI000BD6AC41|nr:alpha/beta fold hydrolase [Flavobacterium sp. BFFFF1]OYU80680.1 MAG: alpha/beta hydrolase [Flavobacterium sp. BFFFF1]